MAGNFWKGVVTLNWVANGSLYEKVENYCPKEYAYPIKTTDLCNKNFLPP